MHLSLRTRLHCRILEARLTPSAVPVGTEFLTNSYTTSDQSSPAIAMDSDGDFVVAWQSYGQDGSSHGIYAQLHTTAGVPVGSEFRVNTTTAGFQTTPDVAMDADGDFVVVWISGASSTLVARRYAATGSPLGGEFVVNTSGFATTPEVAMGAAGNFTVVWGSSSTPGGLAYRRYGSDGVAIDATQLPLTTIATGPATQPIDVAADAAGNVIAVWPGTEVALSTAIYARRIPATGMPTSPEFRVNAMTTQAVVGPSVAVDTDGDFVVAWEYTGYQAGAVFARKYLASTAPLTAEFNVTEFTDGRQTTPRVAIDADGDSVITWGSIGNPGGASYDIYARCFTPAGSAVAGEFRVNTFLSSSQTEPSVAADAGGNFVIAWPGAAISPGNLDISAQRYAASVGVESVVVNGGAIQRSRVTAVSVTFSTVVTIDPGAFSVNRNAGGMVGTVAVSSAVVADRTVATLTFSGSTTEAGSWIDGLYTLTIDDAAIEDLAGNPLDGDLDGSPGGDFNLVGTIGNGLFRLFGDADGDGTVTTSDFLALRLAFLGADPTFDFDGSGTVGPEDFLAFRLRFLVTVG